MTWVDLIVYGFCFWLVLSGAAKVQEQLDECEEAARKYNEKNPY